MFYELDKTRRDIGCKSATNEETEKFVAAFRQRNGSIICRDLLGCDISTPDGRKCAVEKGLFKTICVDMICDAVEIIEKMGY